MVETLRVWPMVNVELICGCLNV